MAQRRRSHSPQGTRRRRGFAYLEVLLATLLVAIALVPAIEALSTGARAPEIGADLSAARFALRSGMEETLARSMLVLVNQAAAAGAYTVPAPGLSDAPGTRHRRLVYVWPYDSTDSDSDGNPFTGGSPNLLWVRVEVEGTPLALETLTSGS